MPKRKLYREPKPVRKPNHWVHKYGEEPKLPPVDAEAMLAKWKQHGAVPVLPEGWSWHPCLGCSVGRANGPLCQLDHWTIYPSAMLDEAQRLYAALLLNQPGQSARPSPDVCNRLRAQAALALARRRRED